MLPSIPPVVPAGASFALGESPFRTKGQLYLGTQTFFDEHLQGGVQEFYDDIADPELKAFISQRFLPSGFYDIMPVPALIAYEARALRMDLPTYLRHRTRWQVQRDVTGVHKWLLKLASPKMVATRLPKVMTQMFDFASPEVVVATDGEVVVHLEPLPVVLNDWLLNAVGVYAENVLKLAGATFVDVTIDDLTPLDQQAGVPLNRMTLGMRWHSAS